MCFPICKRLDLDKLKPIKMSLQLADKFIKYLVGILEVVPLRISQSYIFTYFMVMGINEGARISILI